MALVPGFLYFAAYSGQPPKTGVAVAGAIAATVALGLSLVESPSAGQSSAHTGREPWPIAILKGAGAGAAVFFAVAVTADLKDPDAEKWVTYAMYLFAGVLWFPVAYFQLRVTAPPLIEAIKSILDSRRGRR